MTNLHSPYLDSTSADHLSRLKLGKTLFKNQLYKIGITDDQHCITCKKEFNSEVTEDYKHAMFLCPAVMSIINDIKRIFFPTFTTNFDIADILLSVDQNKHKQDGWKDGWEIINLIWDLFQVYIIKCHNKELTPVSQAAIFEIKSQLNRILKILPKSKLSTALHQQHIIYNILVHSST